MPPKEGRRQDGTGSRPTGLPAGIHAPLPGASPARGKGRPVGGRGVRGLRVYGRNLTGGELRRRVGRLGQVAGIEPFVFDDGPARGVRALRFRAGGLSFDVLADRGLDIGAFEHRGVPLAWLSHTGVVSPAFYEPAGEGWLRSFGGGLLVTCGLTNVGPPGRRGGEALGLHGRASNTPASNVSHEVR